MTASRALVVGAVLVDDLVRPSRILAARRTSPPQLVGRWELPGGKVEPGEEPRHALVRELSEELGISVDLGAEIVAPHRDGWPITDRFLMRVWFASCGVQVPRSTGSHDELRWLIPADWHTVPWLDGDRPIVTALADLGVFTAAAAPRNDTSA